MQDEIVLISIPTTTLRNIHEECAYKGTLRALNDFFGESAPRQTAHRPDQASPTHAEKRAISNTQSKNA